MLEDNGALPEALRAYKNLVLLGEAGSGKTELAINLSELLAGEGERVLLCDMDQTKPLFRARAFADRLERSGVELRYQEQLLDAPTVAHGIHTALRDENTAVIMDVGGGSMGAHMIGQFAPVLAQTSSAAVYILNPYRPWSATRSAIEETYSRISAAAKPSTLILAANPNLGSSTTAEDVIEGLHRLNNLLPEANLSFLSAKADLLPTLTPQIPLPLIPLTLSVTLPW